MRAYLFLVMACAVAVAGCGTNTPVPTNNSGGSGGYSHRLTKWRTDIRCPCSTARFYLVRECKKCGAEQMSHPAGRFSDGLLAKECRDEVHRHPWTVD